MWVLIGFLLAVLLFLSYALYYILEIVAPTAFYYHKETEGPVPWKIVLKKCPSLAKFYPSFFLSNKHLQTLGSKLARSGPTVIYEREHVTMEDGTEIALDWEINGHNFPLENPTVIIMHGLSGSSNSKYIRNTVAMMTKNGLRCVVFNARGCGTSKLKNSKILTGGYTGDTRSVADHIKLKYPDAPLFAIGFSMGANILAKYLGEEGTETPIVSAVCISNPFDFQGVSRYDALKRIRLYNRFLTYELQEYVQRHKEILEKSSIDMKQVMKSSYMSEFDEDCVIKLHNFATLDDYYNYCSSIHKIPHIRIPTLFLNAEDDPFINHRVVPYNLAEKNPYVIFALTRRGGHIAYLRNFKFWSYSWSDCVSLEFFRSMMNFNAQDPDMQTSSAKEPLLN